MHLPLLTLFTWLSYGAAETKSSNVTERHILQTLTVTTITQVHLTSTVTVRSICAVLVNVTGVCRRRRGHYIDEPQYLTFDDNVAEQVDRLLDPTAVNPVEVTRAPSSDDQVTVKMDPVPSAANLESSMQEEPRNKKKFFPFGGLITNIMQYIKTGTVTVTWTQSVTTIVPVIETSTFFIQNCTPSPFPFAFCRRR